MASLHYFGVRHHGPGCARSLLQSLNAVQPDCLLIEGPPEVQEQLAWVNDPDIRPPVALLSYSADDPSLAVFHPFAVFSPEWQALRWAQARSTVTVRMFDLPLSLRLGAMAAAKVQRQHIAGEQTGGEQTDGEQAHDGQATDPQAAPPLSLERRPRPDPLDEIAQACGLADGEAWWNHQIEERLDSEDLFAAIAEAMTALRADELRDHPIDQIDACREAAMRQAIRQAQKDGFATIAVICGAWHLGGLHAQALVAHKAKDDLAMLKALAQQLPKVKVQSTWVPWTYQHLTRASGYGAGIEAPGWYEHLWLQSTPAQADAANTHDANSHHAASLRSIGWLARVARLLRERDLDCSSAHLIETARLADTLAALRGRPSAGLAELNEACRSVLLMGDDAGLKLIWDTLVVGDRLGQVPSGVPTVPLQRDVEQTQKSLRFKPEAVLKTVDLDLRQPNDLARSHLLHRLNLLDLRWGRLNKTGRSARGSFHEIWQVQWQPEFAVNLIEASIWGQTLVAAATMRTVHRSQTLTRLADLADLVDQVLLADLPDAAHATTQALQDRAALTGDTLELLAAMPSLAQVLRYGNVRQTDSALVASVLDSLIERAAISLPLVCMAMADDAAATLRGQLQQAHAAVKLRERANNDINNDSNSDASNDPATGPWPAWLRALQRIAGFDSPASSGTSSAPTSGTVNPTATAAASAPASGPHPLIQGLATRLLLDETVWDSGRIADAMALHLSAGTDPTHAASWLDGFLNRNALVLLHDARVWSLVDDWLQGLGNEHFQRVLPLVRRAFADFSVSERRDLGAKAQARQLAPGSQPQGQTTSEIDTNLDLERAQFVLPMLAHIWGLEAALAAPDRTQASQIPVASDHRWESA